MASLPFDPARSHQRVFLSDIAVEISVGIAPWERLRRQRVTVSVEMYSHAREHSYRDITQCIDYDRVHREIAENWPKRPHTDLLETLAEALISFLFEDARVDAARVTLRKPEVYPDAAAAGVEMFRHRSDQG